MTTATPDAAPHVLENLTEEEAYLYAILTDESGLDQAEFLWFSPDHDDGCFRAWAFQWSWYRCNDALQIDQCARSVGKSMSIKVRAFAFPFVHPGNEMLITAPELVHLEPIVSLIEQQVYATRLSSELVVQGRSGVTHRPFQMNFSNGARIIGRIPQRDGRGVKGVHPLWLELDEAQDYPHAGWVELTETLKRGFEGAVWRAHGVTRGLRDDFYEHTQDSPDNEWTVHRFAAMWRPNWTDQERTEKIKQYGSRDDPDYRRNVLGLHGDATNPMFVLTRLMKTVDDEPHSEYNEDEYFQENIKAETLTLMKQRIVDVMDYPPRHRSYLPKATYWSGMDVGYCCDEETEIFTDRGWLTWDRVQEGDMALSINQSSRLSEWNVIESVFREQRTAVPMMEFNGQRFSAKTTPHHRWFVRSESGSWRWKTTETLNTKDCIPLAAARGDAPVIKTYDDDFVELVAWYWTEGHVRGEGGIAISQSHVANAANTDRIRALFLRMYGVSGAMSFGPGEYLDDTSPLWSESTRTEISATYFNLRKDRSQQVLAVCPGKEHVVSQEFLMQLTQDQLDLFIEVSILGDGWDTPHGCRLEQGSKERADAFVSACVLAGRPVAIFQVKPDKWLVNLYTADNVRPVKALGFPRVSDQAMTLTTELMDGVIWCPSLKNKNWLARRRGSVYFTGNTVDPSEIVTFVEQRAKGEERSKLKLLSRVRLERIGNGDQVRAILRTIDFYRPRAFSMDKTGLGLPLYQQIQEWAAEHPEDAYVLDIIKGYNFSQKVTVGFDDSIIVDEYKGDPERDAGIKRQVLEYASDTLRTLVDENRIVLPWDADLLKQFQGSTWTAAQGAQDQYGRRIYSRGNDHILDACRMAVLGWRQYAIEEVLKAPKDEGPVLDMFLG